MRGLILLVMLAAACGLASAKIESFYIGTFTHESALSKGIYLETIDSEMGRLGLPRLVVEAEDPNWLALAPDKKLLFATLGDAVASFAVQPDGTLKPINQQPAGGSGPCYVAVNTSATTLLVANYHSGSVESFPLASDGTIGPAASIIPFTGSGPDPSRQKSPHAHSIYFSPTGQMAYSCDLGTDKVWALRVGADSKLSVAEPAFASTPPGSGPRHLAVASNGRQVYVLNEMGVSVSMFTRDTATGALVPIQTVSNVSPSVPHQGLTASEIAIHPNGKWLYSATRGCDLISVFDIARDFQLRLKQTTPSIAAFPRHFAIDPSGRWLISEGEKGNEIAVFKINPATGELSPFGETVTVGAPVCILFE